MFSLFIEYVSLFLIMQLASFIPVGVYYMLLGRESAVPNWLFLIVGSAAFISSIIHLSDPFNNVGSLFYLIVAIIFSDIIGFLWQEE